MPDAVQDQSPDDLAPAPPREYVVVARRYRPQTFDELIGQEHVARALSNAITTGRIGHAYLFTGARGVGKTSAARILAKALNCQKGTQPCPCNECDVCQAVSSGEDVDVLEIDGASNRGIDEIRALRQNANVRPSRARFKIYIIDEVHMLTTPAFNALLKTLEEPPEHVKFIFCTTEPNKIPITILSRCQRFDFAGITASSIRERLRQIVDAEGVQAEPDALEVIARRAAGSMRDGQSLLEQLLAFAPERIALADVHNMLGTAGDERLARLVDHLLARDAAAAIADLDAAMHEGVDVALLLEQLFGYLRDCMAAAVGCPADSFVYSSPTTARQVAAAGEKLGLETILAVMQILDQTLARMRVSTQGRILAELALVRICHLEDLQELSALVAQLQSGLPVAPGGAGPAQGPAAPRAASPRAQAAAPGPEGPKKKADAGPVGFAGSAAPGQVGGAALTPKNAAEVWSEALSRVSSLAVEVARQFDRVASPAPNRLVIYFPAGYSIGKSLCERPDQIVKFQKALTEVTGQPIRVEFALSEEAGPRAPPATPVRAPSPQERLAEVSQRPMVRRAIELFGAQPGPVDPPGTANE